MSVYKSSTIWGSILWSLIFRNSQTSQTILGIPIQFEVSSLLVKPSLGAQDLTNLRPSQNQPGPRQPNRAYWGLLGAVGAYRPYWAALAPPSRGSHGLCDRNYYQYMLRHI